MGESTAEGAVRETLEEACASVEVRDRVKLALDCTCILQPNFCFRLTTCKVLKKQGLHLQLIDIDQMVLLQHHPYIFHLCHPWVIAASPST